MAKHIGKKVMMVEKPEDAKNVQEFENLIASNKRNSLISLTPRYNISHFKGWHGNNSSNLQSKLSQK